VDCQDLTFQLFVLALRAGQDGRFFMFLAFTLTSPQGQIKLQPIIHNFVTGSNFMRIFAAK